MERLENELLTPLVERTFNILNKQRRLLSPPEEISGMSMKVDYISVISQAQKAVATVGIERTVSFVGNLAAVNPEVLDKIDFDQTVDEYAMMTGVPPTIIRSDEMVEQVRQQKAQAADAQKQMAMLQQGAESAKTLSQADVGGENALAALLQGGNT